MTEQSRLDHIYFQLLQIDLIKQLNFNKEEIRLFTKHAVYEKLPRRKRILNLHDEERYFRMVTEGIVREYYVMNGREINTQFAIKGDIVCSYTSYMSQLPSEYILETVEPSGLLIFKREDMDHIMSTGRKFIEFGKKISAIVSQQKDNRERALLNFDALGRLKHFVHTYPELLDKLSQKDIASYLNIQPETFSHLKKKLN